MCVKSTFSIAELFQLCVNVNDVFHLKGKTCNKGSSCGTKHTQQWKCTVENRCESWHSSLAKNLTDNEIWKTIPRGGGKLSGGEGKRRGWLPRGLVFVAERVLGVEPGSGFQPQPCQHFRPRLVGFLRRAAAAHRAIGGTGFALGTGAGVTPPVPEPFQLYNTWNLRTRHRRSALDNSVTAI